MIKGVPQMAGLIGGSVTVMSSSDGKAYAVTDSSGQMHKATVVIKPVYCGKHCKGCPHGHYKYIAWRERGKTKWKYIGKVEKESICQPTQKNSGKPQP